MGADAAVLYSGYGYPSYGYAGLGYAGLGYAGLGYAHHGLLLLPLLLPLLPLLLLPSPPSITLFSEPRLCPTPCTLWLTPCTEPCTPAISECAPTTWASRCPARKSSGGHGVCCEESNLENWWKCG